jgi:hypothetical protein
VYVLINTPIQEYLAFNCVENIKYLLPSVVIRQGIQHCTTSSITSSGALMRSSLEMILALNVSSAQENLGEPLVFVIATIMHTSKSPTAEVVIAAVARSLHLATKVGLEN